jgi:hypothetical protein
MKREQLEKANKIDAQINELQALDKVLVQATMKNIFFAASSKDCYGGFQLIGEAVIPPIILTKFRQVIADEALRLDREFESL